MARPPPQDIFLDLDLIYDGSEIESIVEELLPLVEKYTQEQLNQAKFRGKEQYKNNLKLIVLNLFQAYRIKEELPVGISSDSKFYSSTSVGYRTMVNSREALIYAGYVRQVTKGVHKNFGSEAIGNRFVKSKVGTYIAKPKLIELLKKLNLYSVKQDLNKFNSIRVGTSSNGYVEPLKNNLYEGLEDNLRKINNYYDSIHLDLYISDEELITIRQQLSHKKERNEFKMWGGEEVLRQLNFRRKYHHRVFTDNEYDKHGRFYGGFWQSIPSEWRQRIIINGVVTTEIDFSELHFRLLYDELPLGTSVPDYLEGDLYDLYRVNQHGGSIASHGEVTNWTQGDYRKEVKLIMNFMLNAENDDQVKKIIESKRTDKLFTRVPKGYDTWQDFIDSIKSAHHLIADNFYTGQGVRLMRLDSKIAERVILKGLEQDICILTMHDSCICKFTHETKLIDFMFEAYEEITGRACKGMKWDYYGIDFKVPSEVIGDKSISGYKNRIQEWNWHRQPYGDSALPVTEPRDN